MTRVCLYTRISTDEENQPTSLASQHERLEAFCKVQEDWRIIAHHEDRATGTKLDRPGLQAALDLARQGRINQLLVYRIDRLSRKVRQLAGIAEELDKLGVTLRSATEPFDTGSAAGRMMLQMLGVFAEFEHATIVDRVTSGIERRARQGRWPNGRIPFGYLRNERKELVPDERIAPVIRRIFKWYAAGRIGAASIARRLDAEQAPAPPRGWQPNIVLWVLSNQAYVGRVHWHEQTFPGIHEPLIEQDTFDRAQALLKERGEDMTHRAARAEFLLSGLLRCGRCRRAYVGMSAKGNGGTYHYYACSGRQKLGRKSCDGERLPKDKLEAAILDQLTGLYRDGSMIRNAIEQATADSETDRTALTEKRASLAKEIARAERAIERYHDAFENGDLDPSRFKQRLSVLDARLDALQDQDQALAREMDADTPTTPDTATLEAVADGLSRVVATGDTDVAKALLRILIADLRVNSRAEILPTYRIAPATVCAHNSSVALAGREPLDDLIAREDHLGDERGLEQAVRDHPDGARQPRGQLRRILERAGVVGDHAAVGAAGHLAQAHFTKARERRGKPELEQLERHRRAQPLDELVRGDDHDEALGCGGDGLLARVSGPAALH
jgi:site-specific DNA recombinase